MVLSIATDRQFFNFLCEDGGFLEAIDGGY
jgi:hypothetical protein